MSLISAKKITFALDGETLFSDVSFEVGAGECVALTGASGCGKSTLCHILAGVIPRSYTGKMSGTARLCGENVAELSLLETVERVGIVFQSPDSQLFSPTVEDEVAFAPENLCIERNEIALRVKEALSAVGMLGYSDFSPEDLSGGQKQLVAIAAVIAMRPKAIIFDEAFSSLDVEAAVKVKDFIYRFKASGGGVLTVEHDRRNLDIADRILRMENGRVFEVANG